eukprot:1837502-Rhodomonas_salina.1
MPAGTADVDMEDSSGGVNAEIAKQDKVPARGNSRKRGRFNESQSVFLMEGSRRSSSNRKAKEDAAEGVPAEVEEQDGATRNGEVVGTEEVVPEVRTHLLRSRALRPCTRCASATVKTCTRSVRGKGKPAGNDDKMEVEMEMPVEGSEVRTPKRKRHYVGAF